MVPDNPDGIMNATPVERLRVLIIEDAEDDAFFTANTLKEAGFDVIHERVDTAEALNQALKFGSWDVIISDYSMPRFNGLEALTIYKKYNLDMPFIVVSGAMGEDTAVLAMKSGAHDYIMKGNLSRLGPAVRRELEQAGMRAARRKAVQTIEHMNAELLKANEELKALDEVKNQLLSNVSHELRTPLVAIKGFTELLFVGESGSLTETQKQQLGICLRNVEKLLSLINNLLDFSRMQFGRAEWNLTRFDLVQLLKDVLAPFQPLIASKALNVSEIFPDGMVLLESDREKLLRVFGNLLDNAIKFTPKGGHINLKLIQTKADVVEVEIADNGPGIPKASLKRIFDRFFQADASSTRRHGGVGLGLSLCKEVLERLGGGISVKSHEGRGAIFRVLIPLHRPSSDKLTSLDSD